MTEKTHHGVGLLITNKDQTQFFVQIKDNTYPFPEWRGACAYWGGAIEEEDENELIAVEREVVEEIPDAVAILINIPKTKIDTFWVSDLPNPFWLTIFECIVSDEQLQQISKVDVLEGNGKLMDRASLLQQKWIWKMDFIFKKYLELKQKG